MAAAVQSGRAGARTVLIEQGHQVGGNMTSGGVNFPGLFHAWGRQVIDGVGREIITNCVALDGRALPDFSKGRAPAPVANSAAPGKGADPAEAYKHYAAMPEGPEKEAYLANNAQAISDGYEAVRNAR